jgi:hypothetical protein
MSDLPSQVKAISFYAQEYINDVDRLVERFPVFETPALAEVAKTMKLTLIETSRMTLSLVQLALASDESRTAIQEELDRGAFIISSLREQILFLMTASAGINKQLDEAGNAVALKAELKLERIYRQDAERRAEMAEATLDNLIQNLERVAAGSNHKKTDNQPSQLTGLTFPYATKELQAMQKAALKYWAEYTPDKRQPTQIEVQLELCELLGLVVGNDATPPRKTIALAGAIKPDVPLNV